MSTRTRLAFASLLTAGALVLGACGSHAGGSDPRGGGSHPQGTSARTAGSGGGTSKSTTTTVVHLQPPVRLLEIGDSLGEDLGVGLQDVLSKDTKVTVIQAAKGDSGLVEAQFYDWPQQLATLLTQDHPQVVVVFLGANDVQNFYQGNVLETFGTPGWDAAYGQRVAQMMQEATSAGAHVLWVGMPIMASPTFSAQMQTLNTIYQDQAASHPGVTYFSSWSLFSTPTGQYTATTIGPNGNTITLRDPDGIHIPIGVGLGDDYLAAAVVAKMKTLYSLP